MNWLGPRARFVVGAAIAALLSMWVLELNPGEAVSRLAHAEVAGAFFSAALHPTLFAQGPLGGSLWPVILDALGDTLSFALGALGLSLVAGFPLGLLASERFWAAVGRHGNGQPHPGGRALWGGIRIGIAAMRSVHELIWALLLLAALGLSGTTAVLAIAIPYAGTFAKVFAELLDEAPQESGQALAALGASPLTALLLGVLPRAAPDMIAYAFYRFECAIRSSAVLGFFGFPTLGYCVLASSENLYFREVWTYLYVLIALMAAVEWWGASLRRRLVVVA